MIRSIYNDRFLSYCNRYKEGQSVKKHWVTVKVIENGTQVENKQGARWCITPFLKKEHFFHRIEKVDYPS